MRAQILLWTTTAAWVMTMIGRFVLLQLTQLEVRFAALKTLRSLKGQEAFSLL